MNNLLKSLTIIVGILFFVATTSLAAQTDNSVVFQVIQNQIAFDRSTVESATIIPPRDKSDSYGVNIKLKPDAAAKLQDLTQTNIGKKALIMLNDKAISTTTIMGNLGGEFLLTGLTKQQATKLLRHFGQTNR
jgi:preprotein translocase subunit SecD